jgi:hypothetical protein
MLMPVRHLFYAFAPENTPLLRDNQYHDIRFDYLNPTFLYPKTHDSNIPEFHHSNWGEAPNLSLPENALFCKKYQRIAIICD